MKIAGLQKLTLLDYPEHTACTVFTAGCNFRCPFCHNSDLIYNPPNAISKEEFFEFYQEDLRPFFEPQKFKYLYDFNIELQNTICNLLDIAPKIEYSQEYWQPQEGDVDLREVIHPKRPIVEAEKLLPYYQVFSARHGFIPDLSIIDLLFNMGPESIFLLLDTPKEK